MKQLVPESEIRIRDTKPIYEKDAHIISQKYIGLYRALIQIINQYTKDKDNNTLNAKRKFIEYVLNNHGKFLEATVNNVNFWNGILGNVDVTAATSMSPSDSGKIGQEIKDAIEKASAEATSGYGKTEQLKLLVKAVGQQSMKDIKFLVEAAFEIYTERIDKEIHGICVESEEKASEDSEKFRERSNNRRVPKEKRNNEMRIRQATVAHNKEKARFLIKLNNINKKILKYNQSDPKGFWGGFWKVNIANAAMNRFLNTQKNMHVKVHGMKIAARIYSIRRDREYNKGYFHGTFFTTVKYVSAFTLGAIGTMKMAKSAISSICGIASTAFGFARKAGRFIGSTLKTLSKSLSFVVSGMFKIGKSLITAPFKIIGGIMSFLKKPMVINIVKFLKSEAGAILLGTLWAAYTVFIRDFVQDFTKNPGKWLKGKWHDAKEYFKNKVKANASDLKFGEFVSAMLHGTNTKALREKYESTRDEYAKLAKQPTDANHSHYFLKRAILTVMIKSLYIRELLEEKFGFRKQQTEYDKALNTYKISGIWNRIGNYIEFGKAKTEFEIERFLGWKKDANMGLSDILAGKARKTIDKLAGFLDGLSDSITDFAVSGVSSIIGGVIGNLIFPGLGGVIGTFLGGGVGELLNKWRRDAKDEAAALDYLKTANERRRKTQRQSDQNQMNDLMVERMKNREYIRLREIERLENEKRKLEEDNLTAADGKREKNNELIRKIQEDIQKQRDNVNEEDAKALKRIEFGIQEYRSRGINTEREESQIRDLRNSALKDSGNVFGVDVKTDSSGNVVDAEKVEFSVFGKIFDDDKTDYSKEFVERKNQGNWLRLRKLVANNILQLIEMHSSTDGRGVTLQDIKDYRKQVLGAILENGEGGFHMAAENMKRLQNMSGIENEGLTLYQDKEHSRKTSTFDITKLEIQSISTARDYDAYHNVDAYLKTIERKYENDMFVVSERGYKCEYIRFFDRDTQKPKFLEIVRTQHGSIWTKILDEDEVDTEHKTMYDIWASNRQYETFKKNLMEVRIGDFTIGQFLRDNKVSENGIDSITTAMFDTYMGAGPSFFRENGAVILYRMIGMIKERNLQSVDIEKLRHSAKIRTTENFRGTDEERKLLAQSAETLGQLDEKLKKDIEEQRAKQRELERLQDKKQRKNTKRNVEWLKNSLEIPTSGNGAENTLLMLGNRKHDNPATQEETKQEEWQRQYKLENGSMDYLRR